MSFTILTIKPNPLNFTDKGNFVIIGVTPINKKLYQEHKETFNAIIQSGDSAWNTKIDNYSLTKFIQLLEEHKETLQLITD